MFVTVEPDVERPEPGWAQIILGSDITLGRLPASHLDPVARS